VNGGQVKILKAWNRARPSTILNVFLPSLVKTEDMTVNLAQKVATALSVFSLALVISGTRISQAVEIDSNAIHSAQAPAWLTSARLDQVVEKIQSRLEWDIRKVNLLWYGDQAEFFKVHRFEGNVLAFFRAQDNTVHLGPRVNDGNFNAVFGHELVHVILYQKYKGAVPKWLEEGLANYLSNHQPPARTKAGTSDLAHWKVDYKWLASQGERDVLTLRHPFVGAVSGAARYHYQASQALMEMIASHCPVTDLLQLSVGKKLESFLSTLCGIEDINAEFRKWVKARSR
jgi:hypothetical protein